MKRLSLAGKSVSKDMEGNSQHGMDTASEGLESGSQAANSEEQGHTIQKKSSGMFRRLSFGSKKSSDRAMSIDQTSNADDNQSETGSRSGTVDDEPIKKKNSGFFKRLSIGSKKPSFDTDNRQAVEHGLGLESHSDDSSFAAPPEPDIDFDPHTMIEHIRRTDSVEEGSDVSSVSTAKQSKSKSTMGSLFKKKRRKSTNIVAFSIVDEFTRLENSFTKQLKCLSVFDISYLYPFW